MSSSEISLVPYEARHDQATVQWLNSQDMRETFGLTYQLTVASHRQWIENHTELSLWAIERAPKAVHIGNVCLRCNSRHRSAYLEMYVGAPEERGRGAGRAALRLALGVAFDSLDMHRIWLYTRQGNAAAEKLYQSVGFVSEGVERESVLREDRFESQVRWSLLKYEFAASQAGRAG